jgi:hypothetical protein
MKKPVINVAVGGQCCGHGYDADELQGISEVFARAARAARDGEHGEVFMKPKGGTYTSVGVDFGREFSEKNGLPVLEEIKYRKKSSMTKKLEQCANCPAEIYQASDQVFYHLKTGNKWCFGFISSPSNLELRRQSREPKVKAHVDHRKSFDRAGERFLMQHYTRNTVEATRVVQQCRKITMHRVDAPKLGPCLECIKKLEAEPRKAPPAKQSGLRNKWFEGHYSRK